MTGLSRRTLIGATGVVGAAMLPTGEAGAVATK